MKKWNEIVLEAKKSYEIHVTAIDFGDNDSFKRSVERKILNAMQKFNFSPMPSKLSIVDSYIDKSRRENNYTLVFKATGEKANHFNKIDGFEVKIK